MRRMMLWLIAVGFLGTLAGCRTMHAHGVCDCEEDNHCASRQPWLQHVTPASAETIQTPPMKLPEAKKRDL